MIVFWQKSEAFGLDISDLSLKIAKLKRKKEGLELVSFGCEKIPLGVIKEGEIKEKKILAEIIKKGLNEIQGKKITTKKVICSLPEERSFLDVIQLPPLRKEEVKKAVAYEIENYIPLSLEQVYFDCEIIKPISNHLKYTEVLLTAIPKKIIDSYLETLKMAQLQPQVFEIECQSIARALIKANKFSKPLLLIDFGETRTTFIIFSGYNIRFTSTIPVSSQKLTEAIAKTLNISFKKAEDFKLKYGLNKKEIFEAITPPLTDLVEQIKIHLDYYHSHEKKEQIILNGKSLNKILLCGGGANLKGLIKFLSSELKMQVVLGDPWVNILKKPVNKIPILSFNQSLSYTTVLGLALRGIYGY